MTLRCKMLGHKWGKYTPCHCQRCKETRHEFVGCKCTRCGGVQHEWEVIEDNVEFITKRCKACGETEKTKKPCEHDWVLVESGEVEAEYSYESGNQFLISEGGRFRKYECSKCGASDLIWDEKWY